MVSRAKQHGMQVDDIEGAKGFSYENWKIGIYTDDDYTFQGMGRIFTFVRSEPALLAQSADWREQPQIGGDHDNGFSSDWFDAPLTYDGLGNERVRGS